MGSEASPDNVTSEYRCRHVEIAADGTLAVTLTQRARCHQIGPEQARGGQREAVLSVRGGPAQARVKTNLKGARRSSRTTTTRRLPAAE